MRKSKKVEMITLAEMAALAGVSKPAVTAFIHWQEASGVKLVTIAGRRTKTVDRNNPVVAAYIKNETRQPSNRTEGKPPTDAALAKLKAQVEKDELTAGGLRSKYISRDFALRYLDELLETEKKELSVMINRIVKRLGKEFGSIDAKNKAEVRRILEQPCNDALEMTRREIERFSREVMPRTPPAVSPPASRGKHDKKSNSLPRR
jgi:hypothetical protein